jgi:hypothetical protein
MASNSDELEIFQNSLPNGAHRQIDQESEFIEQESKYFGSKDSKDLREQSSRFRIDQEWNSASDPQPEEN